MMQSWGIKTCSMSNTGEIRLIILYIIYVHEDREVCVCICLLIMMVYYYYFLAVKTLKADNVKII